MELFVTVNAVVSKENSSVFANVEKSDRLIFFKISDWRGFGVNTIHPEHKVKEDMKIATYYMKIALIFNDMLVDLWCRMPCMILKRLLTLFIKFRLRFIRLSEPRYRTVQDRRIYGLDSE